MEFRLVYQGRLPAASQSKHHVQEKHAIRKVLHPQLRQLWQTHPRLRSSWLNQHMMEHHATKAKFGYRFFPLVCNYVEIGLESGYCYNPLHNDLDPYAVAFAIATLLNNLFGKSKEPFWQQAYTDLLKFVILLRRISDGYTTLADVYHHILEPSKIEVNISKLTDQLKNPPEVIIVSADDHQEHCTQRTLDIVVRREQ